MPLLNHHHFPLVNCVCHACAESVRFLGAGMAKGLDEVKVYVSKDFSIWLCNCSDKDMEVGPQELFGFNTGVYKDALGGGVWA